jgi:hypothetical protein
LCVRLFPANKIEFAADKAMTARARAQYQRYLRAQEDERARFVRGLDALTPAQKKDILVRAGVLTKRGKFTAYYRAGTRTTSKLGKRK